MTRLARLLSSGCLLAILILAGRSVGTEAAPSATNVCGTINSNATWTPAGNPYAVCGGGATVASGVNLTIEPGVIVQFASDSTFYMRGTLTALGTPSQPITFTGATATPGSWRGVLMDSLVVTPTLVTLDYVTFEYGGLNSTTGAQIFVYSNATLTMTNSLLRDGAGAGIYVGSNAYVSVHDTEFLNHGRQAMFLSQPERGTDLGGLSASGNSRDVVYVDSTTYVEGEKLWPNAGLPYVVNGLLGNVQGDSLSLAPGTELRFTSLGRLYIRGDLQAIGLPGEPITLTGDVAAPGHWDGLWLYGLTRAATAQLDYVTVEYGGRGISSGANILVDYGELVARNSLIRYSQYDGVRFGSNGRGSIMNSQVFSNTQYGVRNTVPARWVLASNNWWGHPSGPTPQTPGCGTGQGEEVTNGVLFRPVLTSTAPAPFPLTDAPILTLTPRRWFAPADGLSRVYFDITLRDGDGHPLQGRAVNLATNLGTVTDGGFTDFNGHTLAYMVSGSSGTAEVRAVVSDTSCDGALSPTAQVTFDPPVDVTELFPDSQATYLASNIDITPLPTVVGVTATMRVTLTNPLSVPITVDAQFGFVQSSIGLAFGPIGTFTDQVIPANSSVQLSAAWVPLVSGHYCVEVTYTITAVGAGGGLEVLAGGGGRRQRNLNTYQSPMGPPSDKNILDKADNSWQAVSGFAPDGTDIQMGLLDAWWGWAKDTAKQISQALGFDPPRQDYNVVTVAEWPAWTPVTADANISVAHAAAMNAASTALADVLAYGEAATVALDRYGGASEAHNLLWAAQQANARLHFEQLLGTALLAYADALDALVQVLVDEGEPNTAISVSEVISYQTRLQDTGFTVAEINVAHGLGWTDGEIEARRQAIIAADPATLAGNWLDKYTMEADVSRELGQALLTANYYSPGLSVSGGAGLLGVQGGTGTGNTLVQIDNTVATFVLGNPLTQTAVIDLRPRRIDLPADWMVSVSPAQATLAPGEQITVTVTILTGSLVPQGAMPRVAVEGYAGSQLLGGVTVELVVPRYVVPLGINDVYLPLVTR